jgi:hypothetical protein
MRQQACFGGLDRLRLCGRCGRPRSTNAVFDLAAASAKFPCNRSISLSRLFAFSDFGVTADFYRFRGIRSGYAPDDPTASMRAGFGSNQISQQSDSGRSRLR